jgi:5-methylcytosine-specific restriction endonuclease McrA
MPFPESVKDAAFARSGGRCECARKEDGHSQGRCATALTRKSAEFHHKTATNAGGPDTLDNCEVLCVTCHRNMH